MSIRHLDRLLEPRSVAVIGASDRVGSVGATVWRNLRAGTFQGPIHGVNPKRATLDGTVVYASPSDLPEVPDLAVLCTPPDTVPGLIDALGRLGTRAAIVMTAGLSAAQKQAMRDAARPHLLRLLGPNCIGLLSPHIGLNASFAHTDAAPGDMAFVSQSGALVTAVLDWAKSRRIGFSHLVSLGERADVDFGDLLDHLASDARTRSILLYIESIESPRKFMSAARAAARNQPVIVVKAGRAGHGMQAALVAVLLRTWAQHSAAGPVGLAGWMSTLNTRMAELFLDRKTIFTATALALDLDLDHGLIEWVCAGHPAPLLQRRQRNLLHLP